MKNILMALKKAQAKIENPSKSKVNPAFRSRYVDLNSVLAAIGEAVDEEGLVITQLVSPDLNGRSSLHTELWHAESEEMINSVFPLPEGGTPQQIGSAITYARRYSLMAMFSLGVEDDDGAAASSPQAADARAAFLAKVATAKAAAK